MKYFPNEIFLKEFKHPHSNIIDFRAFNPFPAIAQRPAVEKWFSASEYYIKGFLGSGWELWVSVHAGNDRRGWVSLTVGGRAPCHQFGHPRNLTSQE